MITLSDYFGKWWGHPDATQERIDNAERLLDACSDLEALARNDGIEFPINPKNGTPVSGQLYGGFRPQSCSLGASKSAHKEGLAVDRYDPEGLIDVWCMKNSEVGGKLEKCGIYIEHPDATPKWSHWTTRRPKSGNRVFRP